MADKKEVERWNKADPDITYEGKAITLPGDPGKMPLDLAIKTLQRKQADEEQVTNVVEIIEAFPMDGAVAFAKAMKEIYGWASPVPIPGFFGPKPPVMISVKTGPGVDEVVQVPWGRFVLPNVDGNVNTGSTMQLGQPCFFIMAEVKKKDCQVVKDLASKTREILRTASIYKGKALRLRVTDNGTINHDDPPEFLPVSYIQPNDLILNDGEGEQIQTALWTPIQNMEACLKHQIPLKRGILLEGPYGCGKTMTSTVTSKIATDNGWTFIALDDVAALKDALLFAKRYAPAVVFAEDADRVADKRDQRGNDLLNTIDGILSKDSKVITVLTTNHVEKLERAMLRPGRLDAVISVSAPDAKSVQALVRLYARGLLAKDADLTEVGEVLKGNIPATVREVVERSKLGMIGRNADTITPKDLVVAANGMKAHLALLQERKEIKTPEQKLGEAFREVLHLETMSNGSFEKLVSQVHEVHDHIVN